MRSLLCRGSEGLHGFGKLGRKGCWLDFSTGNSTPSTPLGRQLTTVVGPQDPPLIFCLDVLFHLGNDVGTVMNLRLVVLILKDGSGLVVALANRQSPRAMHKHARTLLTVSWGVADVGTVVVP